MDKVKAPTVWEYHRGLSYTAFNYPKNIISEVWQKIKGKSTGGSPSYHLIKVLTIRPDRHTRG